MDSLFWWNLNFAIGLVLVVGAVSALTIWMRRRKRQREMSIETPTRNRS